MAGPNILEAQVRKEFGGLVASNDIDFVIPERSIVSLIGPNGAGKTTFFNQLTGVYKPTAGRIVFREQDVTGLPRTRSPSWAWHARFRTSGSSTT